MGLDTNGVRFLLEARQEGVDFQKTATLARQGLHLSPSQLKYLLSREAPEMRAGLPPSLVLEMREQRAYADAFLQMLGADGVVSIDASDYEGATYKHNLNDDLPEDLCGKFSCVIDGGTLEHVFDFPSAALGCMKMLKVGGHFLGITPCNNFMGHGFYQFSPELIWGIFSNRNGFQLERIYIFEDRPFAAWYQVADPRLMSTRVSLCNNTPTYLVYRARKVEEKNLTRTGMSPTQSDYELLWDRGIPNDLSFRHAAFRRLKAVLPPKVTDLIKRLAGSFFRYPSRGFVKPFYKKYR